MFSRSFDRPPKKRHLDGLQMPSMLLIRLSVPSPKLLSKHFQIFPSFFRLKQTLLAPELVLCCYKMTALLLILAKNSLLDWQKLLHSTYVRELFAVTQAVAKWRQYLLGAHSTIITDHQSLKLILSQAIHTLERHKYLVKLMGYDFDIQYKPGKTNVVADALSRQFTEPPSLHFSSATLLSFSIPTFSFLTELRAEVATDPYYQNLLNSSSPHNHQFQLKHGLLFTNNRLCLNPSSPLKSKILFELHNTPVAGHAGVRKTLSRLATSFYWASMAKDVKSYVVNCHVCQQSKYCPVKRSGLLNPLPIPHNIWEDISLDFITGLPISNGFSVILVVVDRSSKYGNFGPLKEGFTAVAVDSLFLELVVKHHSFPKSIVSDRDPIFMSRFWQELFKQSGTSLCMSSAYHPQSDGQTEVLNCLEQYLRSFVAEHPTKWYKFLLWVELSYNTSLHLAILMSPFEAVFGKPSPSLPSYFVDSSSVEAVDQCLKEREDVLQSLKLNLQKAQLTMKAQADKHRRDVHFQVGDWCYVRLQPHRRVSLTGKKFTKLSKRFYGPFRIIKRVGLVAYKL